VGTVVHLALEQISRLGVVPDRTTEIDSHRWQTALANLGLHGKALDLAVHRVEKSVSRVLSDPDGRWVLSPDNVDASSEFAVTTADEQGKTSDLIVDRTFVDKQSNIRWVIDYKNSEPEEGQSLEDFSRKEVGSYTEQLSRYKSAMEALYEQPVQCALYFTAVGHLHADNN
jgi:ATP-dependent exoDNAse (exonuclease V) beta subunit